MGTGGFGLNKQVILKTREVAAVAALRLKHLRECSSSDRPLFTATEFKAIVEWLEAKLALIEDHLERLEAYPVSESIVAFTLFLQEDLEGINKGLSELGEGWLRN